jgi:hypothetical protein
MEGGGVNVGVELFVRLNWFLFVLKGMLDRNCLEIFKV